MIPQTNLQLQSQLVSAGWRDDDLRLVRDSYDTALDLFGGAVRSSGKPFVCHLVGTAALVAAGGGPPALVGAALVHAAYDQGDFRDGRPPGRSSQRARHLRRSTSPEVEALVSAYHRLEVNPDLLDGLERRRHRLTEHERRMLLLLVANEADDHADAGIALMQTELPWRYQPETARRIAALGADAGFARPAEVLTHAADLVPDSVPAPFRRVGSKQSQWLPPHVTSIRALPWSLVASMACRSLTRRLGRLLGGG